MELTVRQAQPADLEDIQAMYRDLVARMDREGWKIWSDRYPRDAVGEDIALGRYYLLQDGPAIAGGFALLSEDCGEGDVPWEEPTVPARYLYRFGVAVEYGGRGVGKLSLERIQDLARSLGAGYLRLFVAYENAPAIGLYEKAGFRCVPGEFGEELANGTRLYEYAFEKKL